MLFIKKWKNNLFSIFIENNVSYFDSGQYTRLAVKTKNDQYVFRMYSFVNTYLEKRLEFYLLKVENGYLSNILYNLNIGDFVYVSKYSYGCFVFDNLPKVNNLWMISTGTGISPYLSILKKNVNLLKKKFKRIFLINSIKYCTDYNYQRVLLEFQKIYGCNYLYLITVVSREDNFLKNTVNFTGRITYLLLNNILQNYLNVKINLNHDHFMICGNPVMINDVCDILNFKYKINLVNKHITIERYW